jgi:hypothetical protein
MIEILEFVFSSFWVFIGVLILLGMLIEITKYLGTIRLFVFNFSNDKNKDVPK